MAQPAPNEPQFAPAVTPDSIKSILTNKLEAQHVEVEDLSGIPSYSTYMNMRIALHG